MLALEKVPVWAVVTEPLTRFWKIQKQEAEARRSLLKDLQSIVLYCTERGRASVTLLKDTHKVGVGAVLRWD